MRIRRGLSALPPALVLLAALAAAPALLAQTPPAPADGGVQEPPTSRKKIERIRIEDDAARIDELRYGGETQSITVQPKGAPQYEIVPLDAARQRPQTGRDNSTTGTTGQRVWKVFGF